MRALFILFILVGCTSNAPLLKPTAQGPSSNAEQTIQISVKAITTEGFGSEDEKRLGIDLSKYFSAFEITLSNQTHETIAFSPLKTRLELAGGATYHALDEKKAIEYYRVGDDPDRIILFPKSKQKMTEETETITALLLSKASLKQGEQQKGLLVFEKIRQNRCQAVTLNLDGISVLSTGEQKPFRFSFACPK